MTQPRRPSGPGEWAVGDWLLHEQLGAGRIRDTNPAFVLVDFPGRPQSDEAWGWHRFQFLARPVENDPEGWVRHDGGPNPAPGMWVDYKCECGFESSQPSDLLLWGHGDDEGGDIIHWRPSSEPTSSPAPEAGDHDDDHDDDATPTSPEPVSKSPENEQGDGLPISLDAMARLVRHWSTFDRRARAAEGLLTTPDTHIVAPPNWPSHGMCAAWDETLVAAANALSAKDRRIAELEPLYTRTAERTIARALKAEARLAEAEKDATEARDIIQLILPLAKGYAAANRVGSNVAYVEAADAFLQQGVKP